MFAISAPRYVTKSIPPFRVFSRFFPTWWRNLSGGTRGTDSGRFRHPPGHPFGYFGFPFFNFLTLYHDDWRFTLTFYKDALSWRRYTPITLECHEKRPRDAQYARMRADTPGYAQIHADTPITLGCAQIRPRYAHYARMRADTPRYAQIQLKNKTNQVRSSMSFKWIGGTPEGITIHKSYKFIQKHITII